MTGHIKHYEVLVFLKNVLCLIGGKLLYNIVLVSAIYLHEPVVGIHMPPPS